VIQHTRMTLREQTLNGLKWSFVDNFANQGIQFVIGIILARLLVPKDFGLIGMLAIFIAVAISFIDSGFSQALIRQKNSTQVDYSTVFFFNIVVSIFLYVILFFSSDLISAFFREPRLTAIVKVISITLLINSFGLIQRTLLIKNIDFKTQTKISIIASTVSGVIAIAAAFGGYGVWSLVIKTIVQNSTATLLLWIYNKWKPTLTFSITSFKSLFSFGSKLLISGFIDTAYRNLYYLIIGRLFSAADLGFYTRADQFRNIASQNLTSTVQRVTYPVLSTLQDNKQRLKAGFKRTIKSTMFLTLPLMFGLASVAKPLIIFLIGEKWLQSVPYLQLLCFAGIFYPLHALNLNILKVKGRSDLFLRLEVLKKIMIVPLFIIGLQWGIKGLIYALIVQSFFAYFLNSYYSGKMIDYPVKEQVSDILPSFFAASCMGILIYFGSFYLPDISLLKLVIQIFFGFIIYISFSIVWNNGTYKYMQDIIYSKIKNKAVPEIK